MGCQIATRHSGEVALQIITYQEEVRNLPSKRLRSKRFRLVSEQRKTEEPGASNENIVQSHLNIIVKRILVFKR